MSLLPKMIKMQQTLIKWCIANRTPGSNGLANGTEKSRSKEISYIERHCHWFITYIMNVCNFLTRDEKYGYLPLKEINKPFLNSLRWMPIDI